MPPWCRTLPDTNAPTRAFPDVHRDIAQAARDWRDQRVDSLECMGSYQVVQTIYTTEPFAQLRDKVSGFFTRLGFVVGEDAEDSLVREPLAQRWRRDEADWNARCSAVVYVSRYFYSMVGSGALIVLRSGPNSGDDGIPETARRFFEAPPSSVSIESHDYFVGQGDTIAFELAKSLSRSQQPLLFSMDDRITAVKSNPYLSDDERLHEVDAAAPGFLPATASFPALETSLEAKVGARTWGDLSQNARRYLLTGFVSFDSFDGPSSVSLETSPAVIALSKALEDVIVERLQKPFRAAVQRSGEPIPSSTDKRLNSLRDFARKDQPRPLELGTFASQIAQLAEHDISSLPPTASRYLQFVGGLSDPEYLQYSLYRDLLAVTRNYRNRAAHPEPLNFQQLRSFLTLLLGDSSRRGLLDIIVNASRPSSLHPPPQEAPA